MSEETPHLVLADDDETVRNLLTMQAERGGFTVQSGENGAEALDLVYKARGEHSEGIESRVKKQDSGLIYFECKMLNFK